VKIEMKAKIEMKVKIESCKGIQYHEYTNNIVRPGGGGGGVRPLLSLPQLREVLLFIIKVGIAWQSSILYYKKNKK
jgi:hypothetical protein